MKSILEKAKQVARKEKTIQNEQKAAEKRIYKDRQSLAKKITKKVSQILESLNGKRTKRGTLMINKDNIVLIKGKKGYNDEFLFQMEYDSWSGTWRGSDESPEEEYHSQGVKITSPNTRQDNYYNNSRYEETQISISDYEFNKSFERVDEWLVNFFKDLV